METTVLLLRFEVIAHNVIGQTTTRNKHQTLSAVFPNARKCFWHNYIRVLTIVRNNFNYLFHFSYSIFKVSDVIREI